MKASNFQSKHDPIPIMTFVPTYFKLLHTYICCTASFTFTKYKPCVLKENFLFRSTDFKVIGNLTYDGFHGSASDAVFQPSTGVFKAPRSGLYLFLFHANTVREFLSTLPL